MNHDDAVLMNFTWIIEGQLAACRGPRNDTDLALLKNAGVRALVRLAHEEETGMTTTAVSRAGLRDCYEPVPDFTAPTQAQLDHTTRFIKDSMERGEPVAVSLAPA
ncbi:MAG: hypothetical protein LLG20_27825 [Acidobacteriales bacterium]|nr:hypothetical protein [Terriglobales bacterium]